MYDHTPQMCCYKLMNSASLAYELVPCSAFGKMYKLQSIIRLNLKNICDTKKMLLKLSVMF